nr:hypothetical protein [Mycobacterium tuberculosis]
MSVVGSLEFDRRDVAAVLVDTTTNIRSNPNPLIRRNARCIHLYTLL